MPPAASAAARTPGVRSQAHHAREEIVLRLFHLAVPWAVWVTVIILAAVLRLAFPGTGTAACVASAGAGLAWLDHHLRSHRAALLGRWIGPVTVTATAGWLAAAVAGGWSRPLLFAYVITGLPGCIGWDAWLAHGDHHDLARAFTPAAEAAGIGGSRLAGIRRRPHVTNAKIQFPRGEVTVRDAAGRVENLEGALGYAPGSWAITSDRDDAGTGDLAITDPRLLDRAPVLWEKHGPSAPGQSVAVPFREGLWADGEVFEYNVLPLHHVRETGCTGSGKALALGTPVPVPSGWAAMGDLKDGDLVFDGAGQPCRVVRAWPVRYGRPCYEVVFSDGSVITADAEHLWEVDTRASRLSAYRASRPDPRPRKTHIRHLQEYKRLRSQVVSTAELAAGVRCASGHLEYSVRVASPLQCPDAGLPVPPYTLGAWLGDGSSHCGTITTVDREIVSEIEADGFTAVPVKLAAGKAPRYGITGLGQKLAALGVRKVWERPGAGPPRIRRGVKHIPVLYQRASEGQRRALLAGLLDTDGWCKPSGTVEFSVTSERLARDTLHLVSGLGYKATLRSKAARLYGKDCGTAWIVSFTPADKVFRLARKVARQVTVVRRTAQYRYVTEVRPVASVPVRCITVDSPSSLYLAGEACIPTHNTLSWYSHFAEGITRHDYACLAADITKGEQFLGPLRPALHWLATEPEDAVEMLLAVHRVVRARCDYLGRKHMTEWRPGCGLTYLEVREEETPDIIALLDPSKTKNDPGVMYLRNWISDKRASRTAGVSWWDSYQRADATQLPTIARGQMGRRCFGVMESQDAEFGLSELQRERGCRPQLWGAGIPGKAFTDTLTVAEERKTLPLRFFWWGPDSRQVAAYASQWPASRRPLDDVTGEALEARPARPATSAFPVPAGYVTQPPAQPAAQPAVAVPAQPPPSRRNRINPDEAVKRIRVLLDEWRPEGRKFTIAQLMNAVGEDVVCRGKCGNPDCTGRSRAWLYDQVTGLTDAGMLAEAGGNPTHWTVTREPAAAAERQAP